MTQQFRTGDTVQFTGEIRGFDVDERTLEVSMNGSNHVISMDSVAPAPALVAVPECAKQYIEKAKNRLVIYHLESPERLFAQMMSEFSYEKNMPKDVRNWLSESGNEVVLLSALREGYTVEKEPLYEIVIVDDGGDRQLLMDFGEGGIEVNYESANEGRWKQRFTEHEISAIETRYNKKYSDFAVPVEEGE